jgi:gamma-glutamyltranspeptidase/glutathione hydrolase
MPSAMNIKWTKINQPEAVFQQFASRRSVVYGTKGIVSSSQPLATEAGLEILKKGGNAGEHLISSLFLGVADVHDASPADAAVATSAALNVTEPSCCGIGGLGTAQ